MEEIKSENNCKTCKYYVEHYVIISTQLQAIGGHCINRELYNPHKKVPYALHENCGHWESNESVKAKRRKSIKEVLRSIETHLYYIKEILDKDE